MRLMKRLSGLKEVCSYFCYAFMTLWMNMSKLIIYGQFLVIFSSFKIERSHSDKEKKNS